MQNERAGLVDIARDFLDAHRRMRRIVTLHRDGLLRFEELAELVGDDERSVLFRLKERCHHIFRSRDDEEAARPMLREAIFDLAVGSLFHEAMRVRENFYQHAVYEPRVRALRDRASGDEAALFEEFARIQEGVAGRLSEGLAETEILLDRTLAQLRLLLACHGDDPLVARFLVEQGESLEQAFGNSLDEILADVYGSAATGYERAGRSLLGSGYYAPAVRALQAAAGDGSGGVRGGNGLDALIAYALGMQAYLARDYGESIARLAEWADKGAVASEDTDALVQLARDAVARIGQLAEGEDRDRLNEDVGRLLARIGAPT